MVALVAPEQESVIHGRSWSWIFFLSFVSQVRTDRTQTCERWYVRTKIVSVRRGPGISTKEMRHSMSAPNSLTICELSGESLGKESLKETMLSANTNNTIYDRNDILTSVLLVLA
jgi:hypothetical protein